MYLLKRNEGENWKIMQFMVNAFVLIPIKYTPNREIFPFNVSEHDLQMILLWKWNSYMRWMQNFVQKWKSYFYYQIGSETLKAYLSTASYALFAVCLQNLEIGAFPTQINHYHKFLFFLEINQVTNAIWIVKFFYLYFIPCKSHKFFMFCRFICSRKFIIIIISQTVSKIMIFLWL